MSEITAPFVPHELPWFATVQEFPVDPGMQRHTLSVAQVLAIKALKEGNANPVQQQAALAAIIERISGTHDMTFRPGDDRASAFAEGKRFVGLMIIRAVNLPFRASGDHATGTAATAATATRHPKPAGKRTKPGTRDPGSETA